MKAATANETGALRIFDFCEHAVRVLNQDGEPWFVAADVCRVLDLGNSRQAVANLDEDEKGVTIADTLGGGQKMTTISESGLYALIFKSRKPQAKAFRKWVTQEVLPAIRVTGAYYAPVGDIDERSTDRAKLLAMREEVTRQLAELQEMTDHALHGVLSGRMRLSQAKVVSSLVGHRMTMLRVRMDLWAPEGSGVDDAPQSGHGLLEREREDLVALAEAVWDASGESWAPFSRWQAIAEARGLLGWLGKLDGPAGRSALGKLLRRWEHQPLGNGLALRLIRGPGRRRAVELYRAVGRRRRDMLVEGRVA